MESSTSSIISALGAGSGVDMQALASNLAEAQFALRIQRLSERSEKLDTKISTASTLKNQISQLAGALGERVRTGDLSPAPTISNPAVATVTRAAGSQPAGQYTLEVSALASAQTLTAPAFPDAISPVGAGTLTLRFGTVGAGSFTPDAGRDPVDITIASGATLTDIANAINASGSGVSAYVANAADGARLVLKGEEGAANGFVLEATETPGEEGLAALAWEPVAGDPGRLLTTSGDAAYSIDGIAMTSARNNIGNVAPGVSLNLTGTNVGSPAIIGFADNSAAINSVMQDLTSALNEIIGALNSATDPQAGDLARDDGARNLKRQLSSLGSTVIMPNAAEGEPKTLAELGLGINRDGSFSFNAATLQQVMTNEPEAVAAMFTNGLYGVYATIDKISRNASTAGNPGSLAGSVSRYNSQLSRLDEQNAKAVEQQEVLRARLSKQFAAADVRISASQSTLSFLKAQVALWNQSND